MREALAVISAAALVAGCASLPAGPKSMSLDSLLAFSDPALCAPAPVLTSLLASMFDGDANSGFRPGRIVAPPRFRQQIGRVSVTRLDGYWAVRVPVRGTWLGLPVLAIHQALPEGGDPGDFTIEFGAPPQVAEQRLRRAGFPARVGAEVALGPPDGYLHAMTLIGAPGRGSRSLFGCGYS